MKLAKYKYQLVALLILSVGYLVTRLAFLTSLPIFTDEAIYIFWGKFVATDYSHWFISVTDGKPPLLIWAMLPFFKLLPSSAYLIAGRLPSVLAGWSAMIAMFLIAQLIFKSKRAGVIAALLYIVTPYFLFHDRLALFDSLLSSMLLWTTYFAFRTATTFKLRDAILWGIFLGLSFLSKATAIMFLVLLPIAVVMITWRRDFIKNWKKVILFSILAAVIGELMNNMQRLSSVYFLTVQKNAQFQVPIDELIKDPFQLTFLNLHAIFSWIVPYITIPVFILALASFIALARKKALLSLALFMLWIVPILGLATFGRIIFPRYFLFTTPYLLLPTAFVIDYLFNQKKVNKWIISVLIFVLFIPALIFDYKIITKPESAPFPETDKQQYVIDHPSGYGLDEVFGYINKEIEQEKNIVIVTQGTFGLYPYAFNLEYWDNNKVKIKPRFPLNNVDKELIEDAKNSEVLFIFKEVDKIPEDLPITEVFRADKPGEKFDIIIGKFKDQ